MSGFLGQEILSQIRAANDIVEVIQWLNVPLKKTGNSYRALCPFHKEKTPSFHVTAQRQSFHCFGCGVGGDVFKFVMLREGLEFPTAARRLAERARISIPDQTDASPKITRDQKDLLYEVHVKVRDWFHLNLMRSKQATQARQYLHQRGFNDKIAKKFLLGYAPSSWNDLIHWSHSQGIHVSLLQEAGLVVANENKSYDRFRDRLMIPIADELGRVVGFSGRLLTSEAKEAKYVNSPETAIFKKGRLLFGLNYSKRDLQEQKQAILCEGQLDWIRCFESGIRHVIAPQGTAFTEDQARILGRYVEQVILCFDSDQAGQKATWRNAEILIANGLSVRAARLPEGEDPDSFIRQFGAEPFKKMIEEAADIFEYKALALTRALNMHDPRNHQKVVLEMIPLLTLVESEPQRQRLISNICDIFKMDATAFLSEFQRLGRRSKGKSFLSSDPKNREETPETTFLEFGDYLVQLALTEKSAARMLASHLEEAWFAKYRLRHVLFHVIKKTKQGDWKAGWEGLDLDLNDADKKLISRLLIHPVKMNNRNMAVWLQDAVTHIHRTYLVEQHEDLLRQLKKPNLTEKERLQFQRELLDLDARMKQV